MKHKFSFLKSKFSSVSGLENEGGIFTATVAAVVVVVACVVAALGAQLAE